MAIKVLDSNTIDKIAAGEVIERPASIVKELCENAIDAGCRALTCEIKEGGTSFIRITDNGCGIPKEEVATAFLRHATSKISSVDDLNLIYTLGFRGEALSSICAVAKVEMMTKTMDSLTGIRYEIEGGIEKDRQEIGVPEGTTIIVRNLFFNVPARRKFLKSNASETSAITDIIEHLALSHPNISFKYVTDSKEKFHTSGNGNLKDIIYRIYGRSICNEVRSILFKQDEYELEGYIGTPFVGRGTRSFENSFVNGRYVISDVINRAVEEAYKPYLMQHKYPFFVFNLIIPADELDINVHPAKREIKFLDSEKIFDFVYDSVSETLRNNEMLRNITAEPEEKNTEALPRIQSIEPFENKVSTATISGDDVRHENTLKKENIVEEISTFEVNFEDDLEPVLIEHNFEHNIEHSVDHTAVQNMVPSEKLGVATKSFNIIEAKQLDLFEERIISKDNQKEYEIIGQIFDTYWIFRYKNEMLLMDQHAAHEKIKFERLMEQYRNKQINSQNLLPSIIISLTSQEMDAYKRYQEYFRNLGFDSDEFGDREISIQAVPLDLYDCSPRDLFVNILDELSTSPVKGSPEVVHTKLATAACKSAVKGNTKLSYAQADALIGELLTLDNPYHCPHGRPTVIVFSKQEIEKMFSRIV